MTRELVRLGGIFCLLATLERAASADEASFPTVGNQIRILTTASASIAGTLTAFDNEALTLGNADKASPRVVARRDITRIDYRTRRSRKGKGALIGLGAGFALGFLGTALLGNCDESGGVDHCVSVVAGSIYGIAVGAFGAGVGALVAPGERWQPVWLPLARLVPRTEGAYSGPQLTVAPMLGRRQGLALVLSF